VAFTAAANLADCRGPPTCSARRRAWAHRAHRALLASALRTARRRPRLTLRRAQREVGWEHRARLPAGVRASAPACCPGHGEAVAGGTAPLPGRGPTGLAARQRRGRPPAHRHPRRPAVADRPSHAWALPGALTRTTPPQRRAGCPSSPPSQLLPTQVAGSNGQPASRRAPALSHRPRRALHVVIECCRTVRAENCRSVLIQRCR
jgi:hypothetical protein